MKMNFRQKLLATIIPVAVIAIGALTFLFYHVASEEVLSQQIDGMEQLLSKTLNELAIWIDDREREVVLFSKNGVFKAACQDKRMEEAQRRLKVYHQESPFYENIFLAEPNGHIFMDSVGGKSVGVELTKIPGYAVNVKMAQKGKVWVGEVMKSPASGRPVSLITAPITADGTLVGIMGTPVDLLNFSDSFIGSTKIGKSGYFFITDAEGQVLAHPESQLILNTSITEFSFGRPMLEQKSGTLRYEYEGEAKLAQLVTYEEKGWLLAATVPRDEFLAGLKSFRNISYLMGGLAVLILCAITWFITSRAFTVIKNAVTGINEASAQVTTASQEVASSSQSLAEGSSEQAASIEETSSSLEELSSMTRQNADNAGQADHLMKETNTVVEGANRSMEDLTHSMEDIAKASQDTSNIIKTIDEIAFQTNLLALNAAVEAARAGEAGAGFAVVADEVRNLALRAAEAAKNTSELIEGTVKRVETGAELVSKTNEAFGQVQERSAKAAELIAEISAASSEQAQGIDQLNTAVSEMDKVVQQNAATAEESASASEEMYGQASQMRSIVAELMKLIGQELAAEQESAHEMEGGGIHYAAQHGQRSPSKGPHHGSRRSPARKQPVLAQRNEPASPEAKGSFDDEEDWSEF